MTAGQAILTGFRRSLDLRGRSTRAEYLPFLAFAMALLAGITTCGAAQDRGWLAFGLGVVALYLPVTSAGVRRLHDAGEPGHLMLMPLAPAMVTLILLGLAGLMPVPGLIILTVMLGGASLVVALAMLGAGLALIATLIAFADVMGRLLLPSVPGPGAPPPRRNRRPRTAGLQRLAAALCAGALALPAAAQPATSGSVEPCLQPHGNRDLYHDGLAATGWVDLAEDQRAGGLAMLADAFLPVTGQIGGTWADHMAHRPAARAFWDDLAQNRILMWRDGVVLLLAGFRDDSGDMRVECWTAGPHTDTTDDFFALIGQVWQSEGVTMTQVNLPADANRPATELFISRLSPPVAADPPLTATDGLRTRITFALAQASP